MADTYFQTATGFGVVDDPANVPAGASIISQVSYDALVAAQQGDLNAAAAAELAAAEARYLAAYKAFRSVGMTQADAQALAYSVGVPNPAFNPGVSFTPLHVSYQTAVATFSKTLTGASGTFEEITEIPDLVIVEPGVYLVEWDMHGQATNTAAGAGTPVNTAAMGALYKNDVLVPNSETMLMLNTQGNAVTAEPALQLRSTGSGKQIVTCAANDILELWAARSSSAGTTTTIESGTLGRTRLVATRIRLS